MPLAPPSLALTLGSNLASTGHIGVGMPKLAQAVALGTTIWAAKATVSVQGTGVTGTGVATLPLLVPQPLWLLNLELGFVSFGLVGVFHPLTVLGLANGFTSGLVQGIMVATVVGVGSGAGVARINSPPAYPSFQEAFATYGLISGGGAKLALALGSAFDATFAAFITPIPIVGPAGPAPGVGTGTGKIL